ncbi:hypothetical protein GCK72_006560 [Caenorhabditis remanei]|uniref:Uncharacterized protein n=1 Tax=Caenorhabditis remanei TaxID=31234 RepID=A0A6A5HL50_CAERE|nr:hypothetical protein GCK72_006560 [Caenorhabditis remanei]KAF1766602.1 hypothetical protein GCK72_006560 [Caenorhabditis remanei]
MSPRHFILVSLLLGLVSADFSTSFKNFIIANYGQEMYDNLARNDLGSVGSYGGGSHDGNSPTSKRAVILVHGTTNNAGTFSFQRNTLLNNGWSDETVYGTTYGSGSAEITPAPDVAMECEFVQQVRNMITVVANFTKQKVDVIGYSLGSPIARKAILGGECADNSTVNLGSPLTSSVETYVSVAGANRASYLCVLPVTNACSTTNGLFCLSSFLTNINAQQGYEGSHIYSIYGPSDDKVGFYNLPCLTRNSRIVGATEYANATGNHDAILSGTINLQMTYLNAN